MKHVRFNKFNNIFKHMGLTARYQPYNFKPSPWPKPNNPYDNLDPNRMNKDIKDE
jgi:hypothetical protein